MADCQFTLASSRTVTSKGDQFTLAMTPPLQSGCKFMVAVDGKEVRPGYKVGDLKVVGFGAAGTASFEALNDNPKSAISITKRCETCGPTLRQFRIGQGAEPVPDTRTRETGDRQRLPNCECAILFWEGGSEIGADSWIIQFFTGGSAFSHVSVDCCLYDENGQHWIIESTVKEFDRMDAAGQSEHVELSGPQYAPIDAYGDRRYVRVPISNLIDCAQLCDCLHKEIENRNIKHKTAFHWISLLLGLDEPDLVTCSGLIVRCISHQPNSSLGRKLDRALDERLIGGEVSPSDLARALGVDQVNVAWLNGPPR